MDDLKELRALRDRLLQSIGWYTVGDRALGGHRQS